MIRMTKSNRHSSLSPRPLAPHRKERVTVSLSPSAAEFLRKFSAEENLHVSTVVETMIEDSKRARELAQLNEGISSFYDSLTDAVMQEQGAWGEIGAAGLTQLLESEIEPVLPEKRTADKK
jgi:hypothetical protein